MSLQSMLAYISPDRKQKCGLEFFVNKLFANTEFLSHLGETHKGKRCKLFGWRIPLYYVKVSFVIRPCVPYINTIIPH